MVKVKNRGRSPEDEKLFSVEAIKKLKKAQEEIIYLVDRGYPLASVIQFASNRYQFTTRQCQALKRTCCSTGEAENRKNKEIHKSDIRNKTLFIDCFNLLINIEVALSNGLFLHCNDGSYRDLAGFRGNYHPIDKTIKAIELLISTLASLEISNCHFYIDAPVSNSGRLKTILYEQFEASTISTQVDLVPNPDVILYSKENVVTSDSVILDHCHSWFNLMNEVLENNKSYFSGLKIVSFGDE